MEVLSDLGSYTVLICTIFRSSWDIVSISPLCSLLKYLIIIIGSFLAQTSLSVLCLSFTLGAALSYPLRQPAPLCSLPSVPGNPELAQKVQIANDLPPYISVESCVPCAFIEHKAVLIR